IHVHESVIAAKAQRARSKGRLDGIVGNEENRAVVGQRRAIVDGDVAAVNHHRVHMVVGGGGGRSGDVDVVDGSGSRINVVVPVLVGGIQRAQADTGGAGDEGVGDACPRPLAAGGHHAFTDEG